MFHKEGFHTITIASIFLVTGIVIFDDFTDTYLLQKTTQVSLLLLFLGILYFFRNPKRNTLLSDQNIIAPIDGKVIMIKEIHESAYFNDKRLQITLLMSHTDVHVTRYPCSGIIKHSSYFKGKQLDPLHKKASKENERTSVIIGTTKFGDIMYHQITGIFGKRIVNYASKGNQAIQGQDAGFMKFNSRVDLILPLNTNIKVTIGDNVIGGEQIVACA